MQTHTLLRSLIWLQDIRDRKSNVHRTNDDLQITCCNILESLVTSLHINITKIYYQVYNTRTVQTYVNEESTTGAYAVEGVSDSAKR